ncbi:hypothetical protein MKX08_007622 [Trichoderma sp. CBMAI-0020]|nr:hypothetical protein MKX08_007622 [Trichoderma sp. CBMAI-0020]
MARTGLGENYETFNALFSINHSLLSEYEDGKLIKRAVTFREAVDAAKLQEWVLKQEQEDPGVTSDIKKKGAGSCTLNCEQKQEIAAR